ncbi:16S rRNA (guanine(966)-N(2))-methyltransferase RsmD [Cognatishimia sp. MH4019]|uniref:16S rRNA (guanine(966)-N(2))-methyltransferase RsmD n=1 Tax=Cognatishimia sp. MH4019 TaxID=2854030 RepID=UPI001CD344D3|nr:16S rRNA (guanine(966)-N(2))-methyltransferase RsmD [Cognatishimia sp. MH4019]
MRIIGGRFKGRVLASVGKGDAGAHLRPTTDRIRESLFNVLQGGALGDPISDAHVLDLFAGTGALGLEAFSRGANHITFVDDGRKAQSLITENIRLTDSKTHTTLLRRDATRLLANTGPQATLVFLDPPYGTGLGLKALTVAQQNNWLASGALIVFEDNAPAPPLANLDRLDERRYGDTHITFLEVP